LTGPPTRWGHISPNIQHNLAWTMTFELANNWCRASWSPHCCRLRGDRRQVTFDAHDPLALSSFWRDVLGYVHPGPPVQRTYPGHAE
jgi:hypothetical protein